MVKCCFCGSLIEDYQSNNPYPITPEAEEGASYSKERCCNFCNSAYVLPIRIQYGYNRRKYLEALEMKKRVFDVSLVLGYNILDEDTLTGIENLFCKLKEFKKNEDDINRMLECTDDDTSNAIDDLLSSLDRYLDSKHDIARMISDANEE